MTITHRPAAERAHEYDGGVRIRRIGAIAALAGGTGWISKMFIMAAQGGPDAQSTSEAVAFFIGFAGVAVASAAAGVYLARRRSLGWRVLGAVGAVVAMALVTIAGQAALGALPGDSWVQDEAMLGVVGLLFVVAAVIAIRQPADPERSAK